MHTVAALVPTAHASRYLQQLCKHWSHRFPVEFTPEHGRMELNGVVLALDARPDGLNLELSAPQADLSRAQDAVADHLKRFAFREELHFDWVKTAPPG